jgi:outer membrane lipoprotein carrier protein
MKRLLHALLIALFAAAMPAAASGPERLQQSIDDLRSLQADFEQTVLDSDFVVDEMSRGRLALKRPGRFRWDYIEPHEQLIVADGERMWNYEEDLQQVTVHAMDETLASSPAMLLTGEGSLEESFEISDLGESGQLHWVQLVPRVRDSEFESVRVGLGDAGVEVMELRDNLGQTTRIEFRNIRRNPDLADALFEFTPPPGTDVIER